MVDKTGIKKDFEALAEFTGTAAFAYSDIHNQSINTASYYDYPRLISEISRVRGWAQSKTIQELINNKILVYSADGEFFINVGQSTRTGGGVSINNGLVLFTHSSENASTIYHEYAHSLQEIYEPFDKDTIKKLYNDVKLDVRNILTNDVDDYKYYLNEMHAEAFAYCALLLRAKSAKDFMDIAYQAIRYGVAATVAGNNEKLTDYTKNNSNSKYYATYIVMKKLIRKIALIRATGKTNLYFDKNNVIKYEDICNLAKNIVMASCYSPTQFQAFKDHTLHINRTKRGIIPIDHNYKKDVVKSTVLLTLFKAIHFIKNKLKPKKKTSYVDHYKLIDEYAAKQQNMLKSPINYNATPDSIAFQSMEKIHIGISMLHHKFRMRDLTENFLQIVISKRFKDKDFSAESREKDVIRCVDLIGITKQENVDLIRDFLSITDSILQNNTNNEYFKKLMSYHQFSLYKQKDLFERFKRNPDMLTYANTKPPYSLLMYVDEAKKAQILIELGVPINAKDIDGNTPLMYANNDVTKLLIAAKADLEIRDNDGRTALIQCSNPTKIRMLIQSGANVNAQDNNGNTSLILAQNEEEIRSLLTGNPDLEIKNNCGKTALMSLMSEHKTELLLKAGANINAQDKNGNNALMNVLSANIDEKEKDKIVDKLLAGNIDANTKNIYGYNMLAYAIINKKISDKYRRQLAEKLIRYGVNTNDALAILPTNKEKKFLNEIIIETQQKAQKITNIRKKVACKIDNIDTQIGSPIQKIIGKKIQEIKIPDSLVQIETKISSRINK